VAFGCLDADMNGYVTKEEQGKLKKAFFRSHLSQVAPAPALPPPPPPAPLCAPRASSCRRPAGLALRAWEWLGAPTCCSSTRKASATGCPTASASRRISPNTLRASPILVLSPPAPPRCYPPLSPLVVHALVLCDAGGCGSGSGWWRRRPLAVCAAALASPFLSSVSLASVGVCGWPGADGSVASVGCAAAQASTASRSGSTPSRGQVALSPSPLA